MRKWPKMAEKLNKVLHNRTENCNFVIAKISFARPIVVPTGIEPISYEPESYILSIELRDQTECKDEKNIYNLKIIT